MKPGQVVSVRAYGGEVLRRRIVAVENGKVYVCSDEEFEAAKAEGREPSSVGFQPDAVKPVA